MYLHLGQGAVVRSADVIGIFDLDNASWAFRTREFLNRAQREGRVTAIGRDLPRTMILTGRRGERPSVWLSPLSSAALAGRAERNAME